MITQWVYFQVHEKPLGHANTLGSTMISAQLEMGSDHAGGWYAVDLPARQYYVSAVTHMGAIIAWLTLRLGVQAEDMTPALVPTDDSAGGTKA